MTDDDEVATLLLTELAKERAKYAEIEARLSEVVGLQAEWLAARDEIASIAEWCSAMREVAPALSYEHKRLLLDTIGLHVTVFKAAHDTRYIIDARVPTGAPITQMVPGLVTNEIVSSIS